MEPETTLPRPRASLRTGGLDQGRQAKTKPEHQVRVPGRVQKSSCRVGEIEGSRRLRPRSAAGVASAAARGRNLPRRDHRAPAPGCDLPDPRWRLAVGHLAPVALGRETAALLAIRDAAVLSHDSAAMLWGRTPPGSGNGLVHVLVNGSGAGRGPLGVRVPPHPPPSIPGTAAFTSAFPSPRPRGRCWTSPRI